MKHPDVSLPLYKLRAVSVALSHGPACVCENCTTARFAVQEALRPYTAPTDEGTRR